MRVILRVLVWAAVVLWLPAWAQTESPADLLQRAVAAQQSGNLDEAIAGYRAYLALEPRSPQVISNLGAALSKKGDYDAAIVQYTAALELVPSASNTRFNLALAYYKANQIEKAARELERVRAEQPAHRQAMLLLADCRLRLGENAKVVELLGPANTDGEDALAVAYLLGTAYIRSGDIRRGSALLDRILRAGDGAEARLMLGSQKLAADELPGALADLKRAAELNPGLSSVHYYYGLALLKNDETDAALEEFRKEQPDDPYSFAEANLNLGAALLKQGRLGEAAAPLELALKARPDNFSIRYEIALLHREQGRLEQARTELRALLLDSPDFLAAHVCLAKVCYKLRLNQEGDGERAIANKLQ